MQKPKPIHNHKCIFQPHVLVLKSTLYWWINWILSVWYHTQLIQNGAIMFVLHFVFFHYIGDTHQIPKEPYYLVVIHMYFASIYYFCGSG